MHLRHCDRRLTAFNMTTRHHKWRFASLLLCRTPCKMPGRCLTANSSATTSMHMVAYQMQHCFHGILVPVWYVNELGSCLDTTHGCLYAFSGLSTLFGAHALSTIFGEEKCSFNSLFVCRWAEVQVLVNSKSLLFYASDAETKASKVIKYVT